MDMRKYLFFDTETTGLPRDYRADSSDTDNWPRMIQLSWIVYDEFENKLKEEDHIIFPEGFEIPKAASDINGITTERARKEGHDLRAVLSAFMGDVNECVAVIGHNVDFDKKIVGAELIRNGQPDTIGTKRSFDTMKAGTDMCKIPGRYGYKWPKLQELHAHLFGNEFDDAHNSLFDIRATARCFFEMCRRPGGKELLKQSSFQR